MTTQRTTGNDPTQQDERRANGTPYDAAVRNLLESIRLNGFMDDDALHALLDAEATPADQKALAVGLYHRGVIAFEQCSTAFYCFPLKEA